MEYFKNYVSNTTAASANQLFFKPTDPQTAMVGRVYYRIFAGGEYRYSFLFPIFWTAPSTTATLPSATA